MENVEVLQLKKDKIASIRINSEIFELLKENGYTIQGILDEAIDKIVDIKLKIEIK